MNSGVRMFLFSRNIFRQQIARSSGDSGPEYRKISEKIEAHRSSSPEGIQAVRLFLGGVLGLVMLRTLWLRQHVLPYTIEDEEQ